MRSLAPEGCSSSDSSCASAMRVTAPKLIVFPTPQPLTAEEQTLLAAATRGSEAQRQALLESKPVEAPLSIASLNIPPLAPPDEGKN